VAAASDLCIDRGEVLPTRHRTARLPYGFGERNKIVHTVRRRVELALMADKIPAAWGGKASSVLFAEVVRVRFGEGGERTDDGGRVGVNIGQRRYGKPGAAVAGATPWRPHRRTLSPRASAGGFDTPRFATVGACQHCASATRGARGAARPPLGGATLTP
jgi:hypothetical protein